MPTFTDGQANWKPDEGKLTDDYLLSLVTSLELGMTAAPFTFDRQKDLTQQQLWLMFLLLMPKAELEATYDKQDGMYHITQKMMENTLISYLEYFRLDITKNPGYSDCCTDGLRLRRRDAGKAARKACRRQHRDVYG